MIRIPLLVTALFIVWAPACAGEDDVTGPGPSGASNVSLEMQGPSSAATLEDVTYRIVLKASGELPPQELLVEAALSEHVDLHEASHGGRIDASKVTWTSLPAINVGDSLVLSITAEAPFVGPVSSEASASWRDGSQARSGTSNVVLTVITFEPLMILEGPRFNSQFGWEMENLGDIDGDGAGDFAVSAPAASSVLVYSGGTGSVIHRFQDGGRPGIDLDVAGDLDADGTVDLAVGAPGTGADPGDVYVYSMATGATILHLRGENSNDQFGWNAGYLGDINGDGHDDIIVGANLWDNLDTQDLGRIYLYSGKDGALLRTIDLADFSIDFGTLEGDIAGAQFGHAARGIGDVNGDGVPDFAVGAPGLDGGRLFAFSGADYRLLFPAMRGGGTGAGLGAFWISSPGDMNGDGTPDIFASDLNNGGTEQAIGRGRSYVFSGRDGAILIDIAGQQNGDQFGVGHPAGDLDGDGTGDLIIAAWLRSEGAAQAGKVYIYSGRTQRLLRTLTGTVEGQRLGFDAVVVDDLTGDGHADYLLSGNVLGAGTPNAAGNVYVVAGLPLE